MSSDQNPDYVSEYADEVILRVADNFLWRMIFFERRSDIKEEGKNSNKNKNRIKFEVRIPFEAVVKLYQIMNKMREEGMKFTPPLKQFNKLTKEEQKAYADIAKTFFSKDFDFEKTDNPYLMRSKMHYVNTGFNREFDDE